MVRSPVFRSKIERILVIHGVYLFIISNSIHVLCVFSSLSLQLSLQMTSHSQLSSVFLRKFPKKKKTNKFYSLLLSTFYRLDNSIGRYDSSSPLSVHDSTITIQFFSSLQFGLNNSQFRIFFFLSICHAYSHFNNLTMQLRPISGVA